MVRELLGCRVSVTSLAICAGHAQAADTHRTPAVKKEPTTQVGCSCTVYMPSFHQPSQDEPDPKADGAPDPNKGEDKEPAPILNGTVTKDYPNGMTEEQLLEVANEIRVRHAFDAVHGSVLANTPHPADTPNTHQRRIFAPFCRAGTQPEPP